MSKPDCSGRVPFGAEGTVSPNPGMLKEFVAEATQRGIRPHLLIAGRRMGYHEKGRPAQGEVVDSVWVLRPPTEGTRYQKPQPGVACSVGGQLFTFEPTTNGSTHIELRTDCPAAGQDPSTVDEAWLAAIVDTAEANVAAATEAGMGLREYTSWTQSRQATGYLALQAA